VSSKSAERLFLVGECVVRLSTMEDGLERFREDFAAPPESVGGSGRVSLGDSGENEGKEVSDLSEIEDAELDMYGENFRDLLRSVCDRWLCAEEAEHCEAVLSSWAVASISVAIVMRSRPCGQSTLLRRRSSSSAKRRTVVAKASK
jgi:hypothetical protein